MCRTYRLILISLMTLALVFTLACKDEKKKKKDDDEASEQNQESSGPSDAELEVVKNLQKIIKGASLYYTMPFVNAEGMKIPCQFPATNEWTTGGDPCSSGGKFTGDLDAWYTPTWSSLRFQVIDSHYGQYRVESSGELSKSNITISGRYKDCKSGKWTTLSRTIKGHPQANFAECEAQSPSEVKKCTDGQCECTPNCDGRNCGTDGCEGSCGTCADGKYCNGGQCGGK